MNANHSTNHKIKGLEELAGLLRDEQAKDRKVTLCHGVFDLLHAGHLMHLAAARRQGDFLVVTVTPEDYGSDDLFAGPAFQRRPHARPRGPDSARRRRALDRLQAVHAQRRVMEHRRPLVGREVGGQLLELVPEHRVRTR